MDESVSDVVEDVLRLGTGDVDPLLEEMATHGQERSFPILGPHAGRFLGVLTAAVDAERVFEFGSGFGYSAAWFLTALEQDGEIILTDYDTSNLETAREFLGRHESEARIRYEAGDALDAMRSSDGTFDMILIDHEKRHYVAALDLLKSRLRDGGIVIADNVLGGPVTPNGVRSTLAGEPAPDEATAGIGAYLEALRDDHRFRTAIVPLGEGLAVSHFESA